MEQNFQYRGDLAKTGLPEVLFTIDRRARGAVTTVVERLIGL